MQIFKINIVWSSFMPLIVRFVEINPKRHVKIYFTPLKLNNKRLK